MEERNVYLKVFFALIIIVLCSFVIGLFYKKNPSISSGFSSAKISQNVLVSENENLFYESITHEPVGNEKPSDNSTAASSIEKFTIEIAQLSSKVAAQSLVRELNEQGVKAFFLPFNHSGNVVYRVSYGIFSDRQYAIAQASFLEKNQGVLATVRAL